MRCMPAHGQRRMMSRRATPSGATHSRAMAAAAAVPTDDAAAAPAASSAEEKTLVIVMRHSERQDDGSCEEGDNDYLSAVGGVNPDIAITKRGILLAEAAAKTAKAHAHAHGAAVRRVWSSPYLRCIQTAIIAAQNLGIDSVQVDERLREFHFRGDTSVGEITDLRSPEDGGDCVWRTRLPSHVDWSRFDEQTEVGDVGIGRVVSTSSTQRFVDRVRAAFDAAAVLPGCTLCVSHGYANEMAAEVSGSSDLVYEAPYTCMSVLEAHDEKWTLHVPNDFAHLSGVAKAGRGNPATYGLPDTMRYWSDAEGARGKGPQTTSA